ncbi:hypothetical protein Emed_007613 [Eimeria media]
MIATTAVAAAATASAAASAAAGTCMPERALPTRRYTNPSAYHEVASVLTALHRKDEEACTDARAGLTVRSEDSKHKALGFQGCWVRAKVESISGQPGPLVPTTAAKAETTARETKQQKLKREQPAAAPATPKEGQDQRRHQKHQLQKKKDAHAREGDSLSLLCESQCPSCKDSSKKCYSIGTIENNRSSMTHQRA